jgi:hypothetical protein
LITIVVLLSLVASVGELYPFSSLSIFDRYARGQSRLLARGADGEITRLTGYDRWQCPRQVTRGDVEEAIAKVKGVATYLDRGSLLYVDGHVGEPTDGENVDILLRTLRFKADEDVPEVEDVVLATCKADKVGVDWEIVKIWTIVRR